MKTLSRSLIPTDFAYYRTGSRLFYDYYRKYTGNIVERIGKWYGFWTGFQIFPGVWSISVEKNDTELTKTELQKSWISHGIIWWTPMRILDKPIGWWRAPKWFTQKNIHSSRSAFSILDRPDYWNKWAPPARAHRRKVLDLIDLGTLRIEQITDMDSYLDIYRKTRVLDPHKAYLTNWLTRNATITTEDIRIYIAYIDDRPLAGAIFIDESVTSEYFTSFYAQESHPYHLGIALMDRWMLDSYTNWIQYCDLDHMRDSGQSRSYAGYTQFKSSIADHDVYFHDMWIKIF